MGRYSQSIAICLWYMAAYTAEEMPNKSGQMRAFTLLQAAMDEIQNVLEKHKNYHEKSDINRCNKLFNIIENEAKSLRSTQNFSGQERMCNFGNQQIQPVVSV